MVYSSGSAVREDISGPGTWAFLPARLPTGETVVVNAGFVQNTMQDRGQQDRAVARLITGEPVTLTGYIRFPETAGMLTPAENPAKRLWFTRDHLAMARALGWGRGRAVLYRSGGAGARERRPETRPARGPSQGRPHAIRHHLVRPGRRGGDRVRGVAVRAALTRVKIPARDSITMSEMSKASLARLPVTLRDIEAAAGVLAGFVKHTSFERSRTLSDITGASVWLKFENLQFTATFKERGALNRLSALSADERRRGVIAASAGNHAQGVAYHAACLSIPATIVVPLGTPTVKIENTRRHGAM